MASLTVRIGEKPHKALREIATRSGESMQEVLAKAIEEYRRKRFLENANAAFAALRRAPKAWRQEQRERAAWDVTLGDGQDKE
jgi:predicted transcriptional regulator